MKTSCFLQIEPDFFRGGRLRSISVRRVTQGRPASPIPGSVVVRLNLDVADLAFEPLKPVVDVVIPAEHTDAINVESEPMVVAE